MTRLSRLRSLPLRTKLLLTLVGGGAVVLGAATRLSFRYWEGEAVEAARAQALLAGRSSRATIEAALRAGSTASIERHLVELRRQAPTVSARVYDRDGRIVWSADPTEVGHAATPIWIPDTGSLPRDGVARTDEAGEAVRVFMPLAVPGASLLEIATSVAPLRTAMRRGARLGTGLAVGSVLALALIVTAMLEREVVTPLHRVEGALADAGSGALAPTDEVRWIESSLGQLLERQREAEARAAERDGLAEVGQMAAEMAHEFKRPLAAIRLALDVFQQEYRFDESGRETMASVNLQLARLTETMQDLFTLARPVSVEGEDLSVREVLDDALVEFAGQPGADRIRLRRHYAEDVPLVRGDRLRLRQAFANVMINALEAMPDGGELTLEVRGDRPGWVIVEFADTGVGFGSGGIDKAFLPFYSTKPQGTGLGLPLVARVVVAHGGRICGDSVPGEGTRISICLPAEGADPSHLTETPCPANAFSSSTTTV